MPRVYRQKAQRRFDKVTGEQKPLRRCGGCGTEIQPGSHYHSWSFRYGGTHYRCDEHPPKPSELTQSKRSTYLSAIEDVDLSDLTSYEEVEEALTSVADTIDEVAGEYREAAEAMGSAGSENEERAEQLEGWAEDVRGAIGSSTIEPPKCDVHEPSEEEGMDCEACDEKEQEWLNELWGAAEDAFAADPL